MRRSRLLACTALLGMLALAAPGCQEQSGPSITPKHPVALPPPGGFTSPPGKGASFGGGPSAGSMSPQDAKTGGIGSKTH